MHTNDDHIHFVGLLSLNDPLYRYVCDSILPKLDWNGGDPEFNVFFYGGSHYVYKYEEKNKGCSFFIKFFGDDPIQVSWGEKRLRAYLEYENLLRIRAYGFDKPPYHIAEPLGVAEWLNLALVLRGYEGKTLVHYIHRAIQEGRREKLFKKLSLLAGFLAAMHQRTITQKQCVLEKCVHDLHKLVQSLRVQEIINNSEEYEFLKAADSWAKRPYMKDDVNVMLHGDSTPPNFLFCREDIIAIDLENMHEGDRLYDLGRIAGELKHFFYQYTGDRHRGEEFISHFIHEYCSHFRDREGFLSSVTRRLPYYMAMTTLRIARNQWIDRDYRRILIDETFRIIWGY
ncbi:MAG: phosphotransferase [Pseudomonadota bacterium]